MAQQTRERRAHRRLVLTCPVVVSDEGGRELLRTRTLNVSDGGALLQAPADQELAPGEPVKLLLRVPRSTPNTYMLEDFSSGANVVRRQAAADAAGPGQYVAVRFAEPLGLELEV